MLTKGWPKLDQARGKVLFFFDNGGEGEIRDLYRDGHPNLEGRAVFTAVPRAAGRRGDDGERPRGAEPGRDPAAGAKGYLVRTRSDEPMATVLANETSRIGIALGSGARWVTTDFPVAGMAARYDSDFVAKLPGTPRTMQSVAAPSWCRGNVSER